EVKVPGGPFEVVDREQDLRLGPHGSDRHGPDTRTADRGEPDRSEEVQRAEDGRGAGETVVDRVAKRLDGLGTVPPSNVTTSRIQHAAGNHPVIQVHVERPRYPLDSSM